MDGFAHAVTLFLGYLTFKTLDLFKALGVDMSGVDEALANWTQYANDLKAHSADVEAQLTAAQTTVQQLIDTDAAQDAAQAAELQQTIAAQINNALDVVKNPPAPPADTAPAETPPADAPPADAAPPADTTTDPTPPADQVPPTQA